MRVHELLNTKPLGAKGENAAANTSQTTDTSAHSILAEAAKKPYKARKPYKPYKAYKPYKPYTTESEADTTTRKMRLKEFLLQYHSASMSAPIADSQPNFAESQLTKAETR